MLRAINLHSLGVIRTYSKITSYSTKARHILNDLIQQKSFANETSLQPICRLLNAYMQHGHKISNVNPLKSTSFDEPTLPYLQIDNYGLSELEKVTLNGHEEIVVNIVSELENIYCGKISLECLHLECHDEIQWLNEALLSSTEFGFSDERKKLFCKAMLESGNLDNFIATKFGSVKRYGGEGAESLMVFNMQATNTARQQGCEQIIIAMPHRGRNNFLLGQLNLAGEVLFGKMKGKFEFPSEALNIATGDVLSHLTSSSDVKTEFGDVHVTLVPNSSHLEAANSVAIGKSRGRLQSLHPQEYRDEKTEDIAPHVMSLVYHGDAAIMGQGLVAEAFNMSQLKQFDVGGTMHCIVNNQLGFTTQFHHGRSSRYCSDIGKISGCPVLHVNGDSPEHVAMAAKIAVEYRQKFKKDIIVDLICFRRWGHNELDDPSFTQPQMYNEINNRMSVPDLYAKQLIENENILTQDEVNKWLTDHSASLNKSLENIDDYFSKLKPIYLSKSSSWNLMQPPRTDTISKWDTGYDISSLKYIAAKSVEVPEEIQMHPRLEKFHAKSRLSKIQEGTSIDWSTGEAMALGSILHQGLNVRFCGQDVGRGTFSHRHAMLTCQDTENTFVPLNHIIKDQTAYLEVVNSPLSEEAVLAYEYGMSVENPNRLVIWEAQFGDFFNPAQVIIDAFISSGEAKWMQQSSLVMLLPHGFDGAGPEHSSCRYERFLQLTNSDEAVPDSDGVNMSVCVPSTPAQYFHLLRRQGVRNFRKPLIVVAPKSLLRLPAATSSLHDMQPGTTYQSVLDDSSIPDRNKVKSVVFCCGKHYYTLMEERSKLQNKDSIALVRVEELCPFPTIELRKIMEVYSNATDIVWSQEEPRNMGAWSFMQPRFINQVGKKIRCSARPTAAAPAVSHQAKHNEQIQSVLKSTLQL